MKKGILFAVGAYTAWGVLPFYWKWLHSLAALQLVSHRVTWSFVLLVIVVALTHQWQAFRSAALHRRVVLIYLAAAVLLGTNWLIYVWAVNAGYIVEASLGYFINPLLSVLMGVIFLRERLRLWQWVPVGLATVGVVYLAIAYGALPWIALSLAFSFGLYGLVKKVAPLGALHGLTLETAILFVPAVGFLVFSQADGALVFGNGDALTVLLLIGAGLVTVIPLLMFASAARSIPLSLVGILQYIAPTLQFLIGVLVYHEPFNQAHLAGFSVIWLALLLFWVESFVNSRRLKTTYAAG